MRKEREKARINASDPLAAMKRGVRQLKATEQARKRWNDEKRKELEALKAEDRQLSRRHQRRRSKSVDSLDGFKLDAPEEPRSRGAEDHGNSRRHRRRRERRDCSLGDSRRDRSRERSGRRSRHSSDRVYHRRHEDSRDSGRSQKPELDANRDRR